MESFKIGHFKAEHPDQAFPTIAPITEREREALRKEWYRKLNVEPEAEPLSVLRTIETRSEPVIGADAKQGFDLLDTLHRVGVRASATVYINWDRFKTIDAIALVDLSRFFEFIWYPGADDIEIFDATCTWMLLIRHYGAIQLLRVPQ